ncbi:hypothetical protein L5M51_18730 [Shewanella sp. SM73]|jgi:hypothetical protein|uniref:hypothetical protein n=1 Tax=unclassified Shewanella TaxID=196818 RepID=UPI0021D8F770|nr:hypothetical protein [Shewanella sp. SM73]MCU8031772.1 hypothetical protein [Shewanella sp. SM73]
MLIFPDDIYPTECVWRLKSQTEVFSNPFNSSRQTLELPGAAWEAQLRFDTLTRPKGAVLYGLLAQLRGASGRILLWDHAYAQPRGAALGAPVVHGSGQVGNRLTIRGCQASTLFLCVGDYFQLGDQLHLMTADATANALGQCQLLFESPMRHIPVDGTALITRKAKAVMMLKDDDQGGRRSTKRLILSSLTLSLIEDVSL